MNETIHSGRLLHLSLNYLILHFRAQARGPTHRHRTPDRVRAQGATRVRHDGSALPGKENRLLDHANSENEINTTRKYLSDADFQFIELAVEDENWQKKACQIPVPCDVLVISGHFGGAFFGNGRSWRLLDMEKMSCDSSCDNLFHKSQEVFLYGCNTLASKNADVRTPEQYRAALIADHFTPVQADQMVAVRYSAIGQSFRDRMRRVFSGSGRLYGFSSVGPSGKNVESYLNTYFGGQSNYATYLFSGQFDPRKPNKKLATALRATAFAQTTALKYDLAEHKAGPVCYLQDPAISVEQKLEWVARTLINPKDQFQYISEILDFLENPKARADAHWPKIQSDLNNNQQARTAMRDMILGKPLKDFPIERAKINQLATYFAWVTRDESMKVFGDILENKFPKTMTVAARDYLCSYPELGQFLALKNLSHVTWTDPLVLKAIDCLQPRDVEIQQRLLTEFKATSNQSLKYQTLEALASPYTAQSILFELINVLRSANGADSQPAAAALRNSNTQDPQVQRRLIALLKEPRARLSNSAIYGVVWALNPADESIVLMLLKYYGSLPYDQSREFIGDILSLWVGKHPETFESRTIQSTLIDVLARSTSRDEVYHLQQTLVSIGRKNLLAPESTEALQHLRTDGAPLAKEAAEEIFNLIEFFRPQRRYDD